MSQERELPQDPATQALALPVREQAGSVESSSGDGLQGQYPHHSEPEPRGGKDVSKHSCGVTGQGPVLTPAPGGQQHTAGRPGPQVPSDQAMRPSLNYSCFSKSPQRVTQDCTFSHPQPEPSKASQQQDEEPLPTGPRLPAPPLASVQPK